MDRFGEEAYFAASNSGSGFVSYFDEIFYAPEIVRRYVIKGGPGTGKSSFLRRVARHAEGVGRNVRYYYCSSDTDSLDGVIIDGKIALLDGTAPHCCDTVLAGACDEIVNLGEFWDSSRLIERRDEIAGFAVGKKREYACAYAYLSAAGKIAEARRSLTVRFTNREKLLKSVEKVCGAYGIGTGGIARMQVSAFGVKGRVHFDTLRCKASQLIAVEDHYGIGAAFMTELLRVARRRGCGVEVSYDTVTQSIPEEILFLDSLDLFYLCKSVPEGERAVKCIRFADKTALAEVRASFRASLQAEETLLCLAAERLAAAGRFHARAEEIYVAAMSFDGVQKKCNFVIGDLGRYS